MVVTDCLGSRSLHFKRTCRRHENIKCLTQVQDRINSGRGPGATSVVEAPNSYYKCAMKNEI